MIIPSNISSVISRPLLGVSSKLAKLFPGLKYDLEQTDIKLNEKEFIAYSLANCLFYFLLFYALLFVLSFTIQGKTLENALLTSLIYSLIIFMLISVALIRYPKIIAGKKAEQIDRHLVFALKDLLLQISSGVSLYNAMINVSKAGYGQVSVEFDKVAKDINSGMAMDKALEKMAIASKSEFLRRTIWQLINTLKAGASLKGALRTLIDGLTIDQRSKIKDYARELNLWSLIYMLFAVAIPTIGATLMVILSSFAGFGISQGMFILFIVICFIIQYILVGFVKARRPVVNF